MGQCTSLPEVAGNHTPVKVHKATRPEKSMQESALTVATAMEDASQTLVTLDRSERPTFEQQTSDERDEELEEEASESESESDSSSSSDSEEDETSESEEDEMSILPLTLQPNHPSAQPKTAEEWVQSYLDNNNNNNNNNNNHSNGNQSLSSFEDSMTSFTDREADTNHLHLSISSELDKASTPGAAVATTEDASFRPTPRATAKRRCSHATDPASSWSDLTLDVSLNYQCLGTRRGSVTSWGGLNLSTSTPGGSLNPYGFANGAASRRPSAVSRARSRSPAPRRRYSITPSFATVSESESDDSDWNDSDLSSILSMDPKELRQGQVAH